MKAGALRHKVVYQESIVGSPQRQPNGELNAAWADAITGISAAIEPLRGRELFAAQEHHSEATVRFRMRWRDTIRATGRLVYGGRYYSIVWVPPVGKGGRNFELEVLTTEGVIIDG